MTAGSAAWRRLGWAAVVAFAAVGVLQWWLGSAPLATLAASYVAVLGLLTRALPLRVAVPAALVVQQAVLLALVLLVPVVLGGPLRPGVALAVLLTPCLAVVPDVVLERRSAPPDQPVQVPWPPVAAACVGGLVMVGTVLLAVRADSYGIAAWSASGDARLHLLFARMILDEGGLHGAPFTTQPEYQESLTALLLDTHGRGTLAPGALLEHDLRVLGELSAFLIVVWTLATTATLLGFGALRGRAAWVVVVAASLLPLTGLALGVLIRDGFLPILLLVPLVLASLTVLSWLHTTDRTGLPVTVAVGVSAVALPVLAFTWTPFFVVVAVASILPWLRVLRADEQRALRLALMFAGGAAASAYCLLVLLKTHSYLTVDGSIAAPSPVTALLVPVFVLLVAVGRWSSAEPRAFVPYLVGTVTALGITTYAVLAQPDGLPWNYSPSKIAWIWILVGFPLLLLPFAHPRRPSPHLLPVVAGAAGVVLAAMAFSPVTSPVLPSALAWRTAAARRRRPLPSGTSRTSTRCGWR
jgi:hypothetical protein